MNSKDKDGAPDTDGQDRIGVASLHEDSLPTNREKDITRRESAVIDDEASVLSREKSASTREDAAYLRESAAGLREDAADLREGATQVREGEAHLREGAVTTREQIIRAAESTQAASDIHMSMLQQANARLVMATIEAQQLAEQVESTKAELVRARIAAEKANLAKSDFLSSMSHELRSPLNAILGFAQLLESSTPPPTDTQNERLQQIIKAGWYLLELINEILDLAVVESGKLSLSREAVPLADALQECRFMIDPIAKTRGILVDFFPCDDTWFVEADRTRLKQVLINLLTNAIKYNREHGTVEVKCTAGTPRSIRISIRDSGLGLSREQQARLFHPFDRLGQETGGEEGTGIGLVVTKQLTEMMGGTIGMESSAGVGSEFWVELVRADTPQAAAGNARPAELASQLGEHTGLRTLLHVEDNPANLMLVEHIIKDYPNLRILSAYNGSLGVELARAHLPEVILMDINLPGMSGIEALSILRRDPATARIPVIAISANAMPRDIALGVDAGFFSYMTKPFKVDEFIRALDDALKFAGTNETKQIPGQIQ